MTLIADMAPVRQPAKGMADADSRLAHRRRHSLEAEASDAAECPPFHHGAGDADSAGDGSKAHRLGA